MKRNCRRNEIAHRRRAKAPSFGENGIAKFVFCAKKSFALRKAPQKWGRVALMIVFDWNSQCRSGRRKGGKLGNELNLELSRAELVEGTSCVYLVVRKNKTIAHVNESATFSTHR